MSEASRSDSLGGLVDILPSIGQVTRRIMSTQRGHAYLIHGRDPAVVELAAETITATLLCLQPRDGIFCGTCESCRRISLGSHPDLLRVTSGGREILKESVEELRTAVFLGKDHIRRVCRIDSCHRMNQSSGNAILKVLEEPPRGVLFVLSSASPEMVLETIRSRCLPLFVKSPETSDLQRFLESVPNTGVEAARLAWACSMNPGSLVWALRRTSGEYSQLLEILGTLAGELREILALSDPWELAGSLEQCRAVFTEGLVDLVERLGDLSPGQVENARAFHAVALAMVFREIAFALAGCLDNSSRGEGVVMAQALYAFLESLARDRACLDCAAEDQQVRYDSEQCNFRQWTPDGPIDPGPADLKRSLAALIGEFLRIFSQVYKTCARLSVADLNFLRGCDKINHLKTGVSRNGLPGAQAMAATVDESLPMMGTSSNLALCLETLFSRLERVRHGKLVSG